ncbi:hypothetical protein [Floridanema evergladense]|uniref:Uncharacterized protein n=1 Tax=Floridaenema evergladense BLCC-F167 TaxID=3153639 RepID=A0ABV4WDY8_9CYAN
MKVNRHGQAKILSQREIQRPRVAMERKCTLMYAQFELDCKQFTATLSINRVTERSATRRRSNI